MGKITIAVPAQFTSQDCPSCGKRVKKSLSTRTHACSCGYIEDRDIASSIAILKKGLCTVGHTGTYATGDLPSWSVGASLLANGESMNVESPTKSNGEAKAESVV
jgi:putative transposase